MQPNTERIRQLVDALRSGRYEQGKEALRTDDNYCCLGVACDISGMGKWRGSNQYDGDGRFIETQWYYELPSGASSSDVLPQSVADYYGFDNTNPILHDPTGEAFQAAVFNDRKDYNFYEIADLFEKEYLSGTE